MKARSEDGKLTGSRRREAAVDEQVWCGQRVARNDVHRERRRTPFMK